MIFISIVNFEREREKENKQGKKIERATNKKISARADWVYRRYRYTHAEKEKKKKRRKGYLLIFLYIAIVTINLCLLLVSLERKKKKHTYTHPYTTDSYAHINVNKCSFTTTEYLLDRFVMWCDICLSLSLSHSLAFTHFKIDLLYSNSSAKWQSGRWRNQSKTNEIPWDC